MLDEGSAGVTDDQRCKQPYRRHMQLAEADEPVGLGAAGSHQLQAENLEPIAQPQQAGPAAHWQHDQAPVQQNKNEPPPRRHRSSLYLALPPLPHHSSLTDPQTAAPILVPFLF